jgi:N-acetyl-gamma-glutamyl-phosphate reductase
MTVNMEASATVGVVGATGYTGLEVLRILRNHGGVRVHFATSESEAGGPSAVPGLPLVRGEDAPLGEVDLVFLCVPHGRAVPWVERARQAGIRVVDLTADHRPGSGREAGATYGLADIDGDCVADASVVANPGCYPTGVQVALRPLVHGGLVDGDRTVVISAASGVTGAGRTPKRELLFAEVAGDFRAYGIGNGHRHLKEMRHGLPGVQLLFQPHLLPIPRGILETIYMPVREGVAAGEVRDAWRSVYAGHETIRVHDDGLPPLAPVVGTDLLHLGVAENADVDRLVTVVAALDNLGKGAAGQAVQNMNLMIGFPPEHGLRC